MRYLAAHAVEVFAAARGSNNIAHGVRGHALIDAVNRFTSMRRPDVGHRPGDQVDRM